MAWEEKQRQGSVGADVGLAVVGEMEIGAWSCGMVAGLINDVPSCQELIDRIMGEAEDIINKRFGTMLAG